MLSGIEKHVNRLKQQLRLEDGDISKKDAGTPYKGYLKLVITAWLNPTNKKKPSWRSLAEAVGSMTDACGDSFYKNIIDEKKKKT